MEDTLLNTIVLRCPVACSLGRLFGVHKSQTAEQLIAVGCIVRVDPSEYIHKIQYC